jgi:hypothetical protein
MNLAIKFRSDQIIPGKSIDQREQTFNFSVFDSLFEAFDVFGQSFGQEYWKASIEELPLNNPGGFVCKPWRELGTRPRDKAEALSRIGSVMDEHVDRLKQLLAEHEGTVAADRPAKAFACTRAWLAT